jgi:hypothetical protein
MDKVVLKLRLPSEVIGKIKALHPAYGEVSRVVGELVETYVKAARNREVQEKQKRLYKETVEEAKLGIRFSDSIEDLKPYKYGQHNDKV